jgi:hypothetical protein
MLTYDASAPAPGLGVVRDHVLQALAYRDGAAGEQATWR